MVILIHPEKNLGRVSEVAPMYPPARALKTASPNSK